MSTFADLTAPVTDLGDGDALECWRWLAGEDGRAILLTALGDVFFERSAGHIVFLDTYEGTVTDVAPDRVSWKEALRNQENLDRWFTPGLVTALRERGLILQAGQCYSPLRPLVLGGTMEPENFEVTAWRVHLGIMGQIYEQLKDLPPGTQITGFKAG